MMPKKHAGAKKRKEKISFAKRLQKLRSREAKCFLVLMVGTALLMVIFCAAITPERYDLRVGSIANKTITASKDVVDEITTAARRETAARQVEPSYHMKEDVAQQVLTDLDQIFAQLSIVQQYGQTLLNPEGGEILDVSAVKFEQEELDYAKSLLSHITLYEYQLTTLLRATNDQFEQMQKSVTAAMKNTLNSTIREGYVSEAIQTIQQIVGYKVDTDLLQNVVTPVLRKCVQPNMVIEQEATAEAQEKARQAVDPVVYIQGQNIVREGDLVTANQLEMLRALGLLDDNTFDASTYGGAVLLIIFAVAVLFVLLRLMGRNVFTDLRQLTALMLVLNLTLFFCAVGMQVSTYLAPVVLGAMLLTGLMGAKIAVSANISLAILASALTAGTNTSYSTEMVYLLLTCLVSGTFVAYYLRNRPQRVRVLLCGVLTALVQLGVMMAIGLMTNNDLEKVMANGLMSIGGGITSAVLCVGLQPLFEAGFNMATPAKLLELSNPNQPLLRKLLLEAPGTYHHSIIVANLAEAAAEAIGASPLLARTGAYFHDVGKLKRPLYFMENQMGENPHDRTDPYVSAAILTAHTRDGLQMAQKYHLPVEIQNMITEHHGDTPVMFFYHKALQQSNGKAVDIKDFRYDGNRPTTRESAIIMLADTIEAAVRSMPDPTPQAIESFIERLVRGKLEDGQLSHSPLTLRDIDDICAAFARVLNGVFHERIEYPTMKLSSEEGADKPKAIEGKEQPVAAEAVQQPVKAVAVPDAPAQAEKPAAKPEATLTPANEEDKTVSAETPVNEEKPVVETDKKETAEPIEAEPASSQPEKKAE